ncbi:MAG TPA: 30S ribosomal protein S16 [Candidatus Saccharibacteria bacterium]|jgi:small subunit ribosomal protein S16|nr:30S ribosomal protein S16 [Candidatus Saccharibacteria bacterium]HMT55822.1 30S ribosomal protein S16 [Candidatus Saccharibacteria bacterium]
MLAIRMQRVGRKGYAEYRVVVQEARLTPTSGRVVARIGHHNPHTKQTTLDKEKVEYYLSNGAQPTPRVVSLLKAEKIALPAWVQTESKEKKRTIKNSEKLRKNQPKEAPVAEEPQEEAPATEAPTAEEATPTEAVEATATE